MSKKKGSKSIKNYVRKYLENRKNDLLGKKVIDLPAGNGITSKIVKDLGGIPYAIDLFPEYFKYSDIDCIQADVMEGIPFDDKFADFVICQEGIEHFTDQYKVLKEFNRVLKFNGELIITTPNYSGLKAKLSHFLTESERVNHILPPNELDSIWMSKEGGDSDIYFGHIFLIGIQKLRVLAKLAGFRIKDIQFTKIKATSFWLLLLFYPLIYLTSWITYKKSLKKHSSLDYESKKSTYCEIFKLNTNWRLLVDGHIFVIFEKEKAIQEVVDSLQNVHKEFGET